MLAPEILTNEIVRKMVIKSGIKTIWVDREIKDARGQSSDMEPGIVMARCSLSLQFDRFR